MIPPVEALNGTPVGGSITLAFALSSGQSNTTTINAAPQPLSGTQPTTLSGSGSLAAYTLPSTPGAVTVSVPADITIVTNLGVSLNCTGGSPTQIATINVTEAVPTTTDPTATTAPPTTAPATTVAPTTPTTAGPGTPTTVRPTPTTARPTPTTAAPANELPRTGSSNELVLYAAIGAFALGGTALVASRRRLS